MVARAERTRLRASSHCLAGLAWTLTLSLGFGLAACTPSPAPSKTSGPCGGITGAAAGSLVYGADDRYEWYEHPSDRLAALTRQSIVALISSRDLSIDPGGAVTLRGPTLGERLGLCPGELFSDEPSVAFCSGTLIDDDLVLTAGHCIKGPTQCQSTRFVFGYYNVGPGELAPVTSQQVFACRQLVVRRHDSGTDRTIDYSIVQLDRPVGMGLLPAPIQRADVATRPGQGLAIVGFGNGIPAKIDDGGRVLDPRERQLDFFAASTDSFQGSSGSGVFDDEGRQIGLLINGGVDYEEVCGCSRVRVLPPAGGGTPGEGVLYAQRAVEGLCDLGWPSASLCDRPAACGDGLCSGRETYADCFEDCPTPACGNFVCEAGEPESCSDCTVLPMAGEPPGGWACDPDFFGTLDGCDCGCGAVDPDCADPAQEVFNCFGVGASCDADGRCVAASGSTGTAPSSWSCDASYYGTDDGCDCECGAPDPDCSDPAATVFNCGGRPCDPSGRCSTSGAMAPSGWTCPTSWYGEGATCDCECGARDLDCDDPSLEVAHCDAGQSCDAAGRCMGGTATGPPRTWTCPATYWDTRDGCDCGCGARDPDCVDPSQSLFNCEPGQVCDETGRCRAP